MVGAESCFVDAQGALVQGYGLTEAAVPSQVCACMAKQPRGCVCRCRAGVTSGRSQDAGQQRPPAGPAFGCSPDIARQVSTKEGEDHFQRLACAGCVLPIPRDVLDEPVDDDAAAAAPGEGVPGQ